MTILRSILLLVNMVKFIAETKAETICEIKL